MTVSLLTAATLLCGLLVGLIPVLVDGLRPSIQARLRTTDAPVDWLVRLFYFTWLPAMPAAGWLLDLFHNKEILFAGLVALVLGLAALAVARTRLSVMLIVIVLGIAHSCVAVAVVSLLPSVVFDEATQGYRLASTIASLCVGFGAVVVGAWIAPLVVRAAERFGHRQTLLYTSIAFIAPAALVAVCDRHLFPPAERIAPWAEILRQPLMSFLIGAVLLYFALQTCLALWPDAFLKEIGYEERGVRFHRGVFQVAFLGARIGAAWWLYEHPGQATLLTIGLVLVAALLLGYLAGGPDFGGGGFCHALLGAALGPLLPALLGMAIALPGKPIPLSLLGAILALDALATLVVRPAIGALVAGHSARSALWVPLGLTLALVPLLLLTFVRF
jgi:MFS family permease